MKIKILLILFLAINNPLFSQETDRTLPADFTSYITQKDYQQLLDFTLQQLEGFEVLEVKEGTIRIQFGEQSHAFSMLPLIQQSAALDDEQQQAFVHEYISTLINAYDDQSTLASADFSTVKKYLTLRLYPEGVFQEAERERWVVRSDLEGTVTCVMLNLPTAFATVERAQLDQWGVSETEVFELAQENSGKRPYEVHRKMLGETTELLVLAGGSSAATAALALEAAMPEPIGRYGAIVAVPHQEMVLVHNMQEEGPVNYQTFIEYLYEFVLEQYTQHTAPVSPDFYWYYEGKFTRILLGQNQAGQLQIVPPMTSSQFVGE